jgi:hypothetical protein
LRFFVDSASMIGHTLFGTVASSLAAQLSAARQASGHDALPPSDGSRSASSSLLGILGGAALEGAGSILRRELRYGVVPELERSLRIVANATPVAVLDVPRALDQWKGISLAADQLWVDIGSGDGESLGRLARRHAGRFVGVDKENSPALALEAGREANALDALPGNVKYLMLCYNRPDSCMIPRHERLQYVPLRAWSDRPSNADRIMDATVDTIGAGSASVVSLLFPYTESGEQSSLGRVLRGPIPQTLDYQLTTAVRLLRPGGLGVALLESGEVADRKRVLERALHALRASPELSWIGFTRNPVPAEDLGLAPYAPTDARGRAVDTEALREGRIVFFRAKA